MRGLADDREVLLEERPKTDRPPMFRVILLNDDFTPMEFVVWLLRSVFHMPEDSAVRVMLQVHREGSGLAGVYPYDVAQTKLYEVHALAEKNEHPLRGVMEPEGKSDEDR